MELRIRSLGWARKKAEQIQIGDLAHQQLLAAVFGQTPLDKYPCMKDDGKLTSYATPWAKQFERCDDMFLVCTLMISVRSI